VSAQRPGVFKHSLETDPRIKAFSSSVIGLVDMRDIDDDLLRDFV
jgi:hypothetical protein